jgi:pheromone shutdown-related protein TraB
MIILIGTGHVFDLSSAIQNILNEKNPDIICVELDKQRFKALLMKNSNPEKYKESSKQLPFIYKLLSRFQEGLAKEYGVSAGDEMLTAINYAKYHQIPVAFIDMNAQYLFKKMLKSMTISEKFKLFLSGFGGLFVSKKRIEKELSKFQQDFDSYIKEIGEKFPTIRRILIDERNHYMTQKLASANEEYQTIIAVLGDGHIPGISEELKSKDIDFETIRLQELRKQKPVISDSSTASFTTEYKSP